MSQQPFFLRFWSKVLIDDSDKCWEWQASLCQGYGQFGGGGEAVRPVSERSQRAHRIAWALLVGPIPDGLTLDHLCRNRKCVNPTHLEPVAERVNILRGFSPPAENALATVCAHGHPLEGSNVYRWKHRRYCRACRERLWKEAEVRRSQVRVRIGLRRGERNHQAKLTAEAVVELRRERAGGASWAELGRRYGITPQAARAVGLRQSWAHVA